MTANSRSNQKPYFMQVMSNRLTTASGASSTIVVLNFIACCKCYWSTLHTQEWSVWLLLSLCPWADSVLWCLLQRMLWAAATHQCVTHNRGRSLWWMVNGLLVEYNLASLHCSVDIQPHPHRSWPTSRLLSLQELVLHPMWYTSLQ